MPAPAAPVRTGGPDSTWPHKLLYDRVIDALHALPSRFRTSLRIAGISATDLFTLNTPLGAAIESSVVENLNDLRELWDPDGKYEVYGAAKNRDCASRRRDGAPRRGLPRGITWRRWAVQTGAMVPCRLVGVACDRWR